MEVLIIIIQSLLTFFQANFIWGVRYFSFPAAANVLLGIALAVWFVFFNIKPTLRDWRQKRIQTLKSGSRLLTVFLVSSTASIAWLIYVIIEADYSAGQIIGASALVFVSEFIIFWNGTIKLYLNCHQMGIKWRVIGIICGVIPIINIIILIKTIHIANEECRVELEKLALDETRAENELCKTKYPLLMVHGVFFRDFRFFNYWGRVPAELKRNGAEIYYGNQQSAAPVAKSAEELAKRIKSICYEMACEKVNIIAHSKGGLDSRYAISNLGCDKYVASLTTINTPHHGCKFADYILSKVSPEFCKSVADKYNYALKRLGDDNPDFTAAVTDLTAESCEKLNQICPNKDGVYYQSVGSKAENAKGGRFPLNLSYHLAKYFDGDNDGLVSVPSMQWGENFIMLTPQGKRGITHGDVIDLNRENIKGFDVREFYVDLVSGLKKKGF